MPDLSSIHVSVPAVRVDVDLSPLVSFLHGEDGKLIALDYHHEPDYPHLSGPVLRVRLPDGRVVRTEPARDGVDFRRNDTTETALVDEDVAEVMHRMQAALTTAFQDELLPRFFTEAADAIMQATAVAAALHKPAGQ